MKIDAELNSETSSETGEPGAEGHRLAAVAGSPDFRGANSARHRGQGAGREFPPLSAPGKKSKPKL